MDKFQKDFTRGSITRHLLFFSWPFLVSNFIQALYSMADILIVGQYIGPIGMSAVQTSSQLTLFITNAVIGLSVGGTVLIAQYLGAKKYEDERETIGTLLSVFLIAAVVITIVMLFLSKPLLNLLNTPGEAFQDAKEYFDICMVGTVFVFGYNAVTAILRAMGNSKLPMIFVAIACVVNIFLDILFVGPFGMRAKGAALATIIAQALSFLLSIAYLYIRRKDFIFKFTLHSFAIKKDKLIKMMKIGVPMSIQSSLVQFSFLSLTSIANTISGIVGSTVIGIASKVNSFAILPGLAMSSSISSMVGQNISVEKYDRARKTMFVGMRITFCISLLIFIFVQISPHQIVRAFITQDIEAFAAQNQILIAEAERILDECFRVGTLYIRLGSFDYIFTSVIFCINGLMIGAGKTTVTLFNSFISSILIRVPVAYLLSTTANLGMSGIAIASSVAPISSLLLIIYFYRKGTWKQNLQ